VRDWYAPIVADAEAGFGGALNCFELMKVSKPHRTPFYKKVVEPIFRKIGGSLTEII